jgi:hypothetical protein
MHHGRSCPGWTSTLPTGRPGAEMFVMAAFVQSGNREYWA